ncbi:class I SAM-dependent methyltransferase [Victivallis vadensis]|uniref:class I SAM-dependent methyltransferase n=1 Tax=Victivallis vadensis TaxID=172901 RepID=UPI003AF5603D
MQDNTEKFTGLGEVYRRYRPGYPAALFDCLKTFFGVGPDTVAAEIGSGTGIFARLLLEQGIRRLYAVEPNADMRKQAERELGGMPGFVSVVGAAERTTLAAGSVDAVFAVQAFHWFDPVQFREECRRILRSGGPVILIWNSRIETDPLMAECREICRKHCPDFTGFSGHSSRSGKEAVSEFFAGKFESREFPNPLWMDRETFLGRNLSSSYAPRPDAPQYRPFVEELGALFDRYAENGQLRWNNATRCYSGRL